MKPKSNITQSCNGGRLFSPKGWQAVYGTASAEEIQRQKDAADLDRELARAVAEVRRAFEEKRAILSM